MPVLLMSDTLFTGAEKINAAFSRLLDDPELISATPSEADYWDTAWGKVNRNFARLLSEPKVLPDGVWPAEAVSVINENFEEIEK